MEIKMINLPNAVIGKINVQVGQKVNIDDELLQIESKKGNRTIKATAAGTISKINVSEGDSPSANSILLEIQEGIQIVAPAILNDGVVGKINVSVGQTLHKNDELMQVETKKGNRPFKSLYDGVIKEILVQEGNILHVNQTCFIIEEINEPIIEKNTLVKETKIYQPKHADLLIIGAGTGGYVASIHAAKHGKKVVLIEKEHLGGTCLNVGCIPTKTLIASANCYEKILKAADFGIDLTEKPQVNMPAIIKRKNDVVSRLVGGIDYLMKKNKIEIIKGNAMFKDQQHVLINDFEYNFDDCIIATGSKVSTPNIPGIQLEGILDSTKALNLEKLPQSITIVGAGVIGLEFAFMYAKLGSKVTVLEFANRPLSMIDSSLSDEISEHAKKAGIRLICNAKVTAFNKSENNLLITSYEHEKQIKYTVSDNVLVAIGRQPQIDGLGLENTSIELNEHGKGIKVNDFMQTNVEHIYAVGDVNNKIQLAHAASHQGIIAVDNILGNKESFNIDLVPSVIFTSPEIATVGINEDLAKVRNINYKVGTFHYSSNGKAMANNETAGFIKLIKDENNILIGGEIIGSDAANMIATITLAITNKLTDQDLTKTIFAHPTTAEIIHEAGLDLDLGAYHE